MRALNVFLSVVVSLALFLVLLEGGLRLVGLGPKSTIHRFDPVLGWSKTPGATGEQSTTEFDVTYRINEQGLRDDPMPDTAKPAGTLRVLALGDSFVLGYTVEREDLFVDQLERLWQSEGRRVDVVNAGTEGWSTDQEVLWFLENGERFEPDLVLLFPYENDIYWSGRTSYTRFPKPRFTAEGGLEERPLVDPGERPWHARWALGSVLGRSQPPADEEPWSPDGQRQFAGIQKEYAAYFHDPPPFIEDAVARVGGALRALQAECDRLGADLFVIPIPNKAAVDEGARASLERFVAVPTGMWSPDRPVDTFLGLAEELGIPALDPRPALRASAAKGEALYFGRDWHFNPHGNRVFAEFLAGALEQAGAFPAEHAARGAGALPPEAPAEGGIPGWGVAFLVLWGGLGALYCATYRDERVGPALLKVGGLLALVFAIVIGGSAALAQLPPAFARFVLVLFVLAILVFVLYKLGRRTGTIVELVTSFVWRGHWYLLPLVIVLLTVGSLLVVAASSPLVAPFIYTLF